MTFEERLDELGVRITNTEMRLLKESSNELEDLFFQNWSSKDLLETFVKTCFNKIQIEKKNGQFSNYQHKDVRFVLCKKNWLVLADNETKTLLFYKIA